MATEIERKFLVVDDTYKAAATSKSHIVQGYICSARGRTVRVRLRDGRAYLTIKGPSLDGGLSRYEFEKEISPDEGQALLGLCEPGVIDKVRWLVPCGGHVYEVDEFAGDNAGGRLSVTITYAPLARAYFTISIEPTLVPSTSKTLL